MDDAYVVLNNGTSEEVSIREVFGTAPGATLCMPLVYLSADADPTVDRRFFFR